MESNNTNPRKKLTLNKKTLSKLDRDQSLHIKGGTAPKKHVGGDASYADVTIGCGQQGGGQ